MLVEKPETTLAIKIKEKAIENLRLKGSRIDAYISVHGEMDSLPMQSSFEDDRATNIYIRDNITPEIATAIKWMLDTRGVGLSTNNIRQAIENHNKMTNAFDSGGRASVASVFGVERLALSRHHMIAYFNSIGRELAKDKVGFVDNRFMFYARGFEYTFQFNNNDDTPGAETLCILEVFGVVINFRLGELKFHGRDGVRINWSRGGGGAEIKGLPDDVMQYLCLLKGVRYSHRLENEHVPKP